MTSFVCGAVLRAGSLNGTAFNEAIISLNGDVFCKMVSLFSSVLV